MDAGSKAYALNNRQLRYKTLEILKKETFRDEIISLIDTYAAKMISPLFSASYHSTKHIQWHAVSSFGYLARHLIDKDRSRTRDIIRRCIWMLTDESGGIPWMAPAIMGEIMANDKVMAENYSSILISYVDETNAGPDNFLDNLLLRISAFWGIFRLSQSFPEFVRQNEKIILQRLDTEKDPDSIILLCLIAVGTGLDIVLSKAKKVSGNSAKSEVYIDEKFRVLTMEKALNFRDNTTYSKGGGREPDL